MFLVFLTNFFYFNRFVSAAKRFYSKRSGITTIFYFFLTDKTVKLITLTVMHVLVCVFKIDN